MLIISILLGLYFLCCALLSVCWIAKSSSNIFHALVSRFWARNSFYFVYPFCMKASAIDWPHFFFPGLVGPAMSSIWVFFYNTYIFIIPISVNLRFVIYGEYIYDTNDMHIAELHF